MRRLAPLLLMVVGLFFAATLAGCGNGGGATATQGSAQTTTSAKETTTTAPSGTTSQTTVNSSSGPYTADVYFSKDEKICAAARKVPTTSIGAAAMASLLQGPTAEEKSGGMSTSIPAGTRLLGLNIKNGVATVDLSGEFASGGGTLSMTTRLAQVVFTLTQFPSVNGVNFMLDGKTVKVFGGEGIILDHPVNRSDYEQISPAILVESPTLGQFVGNPLRVRGTANVFEAVLKIDVVSQSGKVVLTKRVVASSGTGTRGTFDVTIPFTLSQATIVVYSESPKDGSRINVVRIPVRLGK